MAQSEEYIIRLVDKGVSKGLADIMGQVNDLRQDMDRLKGGIGKGSTGVTGRFAGLNKVMGGLAFAGVGYGMTQLGRNMVDLTVQMEQNETAFSVFLGSTEKAKKLIEDLNAVSVRTPFEPQQVINATKTLMAFGMGVEEAKGSLDFLGDVSAGTGKDLKELAVIFGQIRGLGRLQGQDLLQLINAGFNPLQNIAKRTGKTMSQLKDEMSKGLIPFSQVKQAFIDATSEGGLFNNMTQKMSKTLGGRLSTLRGDFKLAMTELGEALAPILKALTELAIRFLKHKEIVKTIAISVGVLTGAFLIFKGVMLAVNAVMYANPIGLIAVGIAALIVGIIALIRHWDTLTDRLREFGFVGNMIADVMDFIKEGWNNLVNAFKSGGILGALRKIGVMLIQKMLLPITGMIKLLAKLPGKVGRMFKKVAELSDNMFSKLAGDEKNKKIVELQTQKEKVKKNTEVKKTGLSVMPELSNATSSSNIKGGLSEVKAAAPKNFNINIGSLVKEQNFEMIKNPAELNEVIKREVSRLFLGLVNDVQTT